MYISRLKLSLLNEHTLKAMTNPAIFHGAIASITPTSLDGTRIRTLWRLDNDNLILVTPFKPSADDLKKLHDQFGKEAGQTKDYDEFLSQIRTGRLYYFHLQANPVRLDSSNKRHGLTKKSDMASWLLFMGKKWGFAPDLSATMVYDIEKKKAVKSDEEKITFISASFDGVLSVTDAEQFRRALIHGIGHEKAYGCGLMTVLPIGQQKGKADGKI